MNSDSGSLDRSQQPVILRLRYPAGGKSVPHRTVFDWYRYGISCVSRRVSVGQVKSSSGATRPRGDYPGPASYNFLPRGHWRYDRTSIQQYPTVGFPTPVSDSSIVGWDFSYISTLLESIPAWKCTTATKNKTKQNKTKQNKTKNSQNSKDVVA